MNTAADTACALLLFVSLSLSLGCVGVRHGQVAEFEREVSRLTLARAAAEARGEDLAAQLAATRKELLILAKQHAHVNSEAALAGHALSQQQAVDAAVREVRMKDVVG